MKTVVVQNPGFPGLAAETEDYLPQAHMETTSYIAQEYELWKNLFHAQPIISKHLLETQGRKLAEAILQGESRACFSLLDEVTLPVSTPTNELSLTFPLPAAMREQKVGSPIDCLMRKNLITALRRKLDELETHIDSSVAAGAGLIRYATAIHMVYQMLPTGQKVVYSTAPGEEIPAIPVTIRDEAISALAGFIDTNAEHESVNDNRSGGQITKSYVLYTRYFYLPQWVSFDNQDDLLVDSIEEAEAHLASMQHFLKVLETAVSLAPYLVVDPEYQQKRYGMLGQLVNQGRAMARYEMKEIIQIIREREKANNLNRGLSLDITYFDDHCLERKTLRIDVVPAGKIMFLPAFVVLAARKERSKISQDTQLSYSTRKHLQAELMELEHAFDTSKSQHEK